MTDNAARRPRWPFVAFPVLLALGALLTPVFPRQQSAGIRARFDQIQNGMTEDQVGDLLGGPRGVYARRTGKAAWVCPAALRAFSPLGRMTGLNSGSGVLVSRTSAMRIKSV